MISLAIAQRLPKSAILVYLFLKERGGQPVGCIAEACGLSIQSVYTALKALKEIGHDHAFRDHDQKGTIQKSLNVSKPPEASSAQSPDNDVDPLMVRLCAFDVLPWCAEMIILKIERGELRRDDVERQLGYHQVRLDAGFKFKSHPARFLFTAILKNFAPPATPQPKDAYSGGHAATVAPQRARKEHPFGAATLERRAEFAALERERLDDENRRRSLLAMYANQCRPERGARRKTPEQLLTSLEKNGLSLTELQRAIAQCELEVGAGSSRKAI